MRRYGAKGKNMFLLGRLSLLLLLGALVLMPVACDNGSSGNGTPSSVSGKVTDPAGDAVANATVYLIPAGDVDVTPFDARDVLDAVDEGDGPEAFDEPLEDLIDANGSKKYPQAQTGSDGSYRIDGVPDGSYFFFVKPKLNDDYLPGGSQCRVARHTDAFLGTTVDIEVSGETPGDAKFVGTTMCLSCHEDYESEKFLAHRLGISVPGSIGKLQSHDRHPDFDNGLAKFTEASAYTDPGVTKLFLEDYDSSRGFDKFKVYEGATGGGTVYLNVYLWKAKSNGKYKITVENVINPADTGSPRTFVARLTYGGAIFKQRYLVEVPGMQGLFPLVQFQFTGNNSRYDTGRLVFRDYHADWHWDNSTQTLKDPPIYKTFSGNCGACHFTGWKGGPVDANADPHDTPWLADAVDDPAGVYDIDGDGTLDELNTGCESCHGAGSNHVEDGEGRYIISPDLLSPSRSTMVCGRCHDRIEGVWALGSDSPIDANNEMAPPGIRRADYLANYVTRKGPALGSMWGDELHSKSHHQQYADHIKSSKYRNDSQLVSCEDCHDTHGFSKYRFGLVADPDDPDSKLCQKCHAIEITDHMLEYVGSVMNGKQARCVDCHMPKTAKSGAGHYGLLLGTPTGDPGTDPDIVYWQNDISSHIFDVPAKWNVGVKGKTPGKAMPIPYVNACGTCHDASQIKYD